MNKKGYYTTNKKRSAVNYWIDNSKIQSELYQSKNSAAIAKIIQLVLFLLIGLFILLSCGIPNLIIEIIF